MLTQWPGAVLDPFSGEGAGFEHGVFTTVLLWVSSLCQ